MANRFLQLDDVAANAMTIIPNATSEDRLIFKQWVWLAIRDIGTYTGDIDTTEITPVDNTIAKPDDFVMAADLALFDENGSEIYYKYRSGKQRIHEDIELDLQNNIEISEDNFFFYMSSNATNVTTAKLRYFKFPLDSDGQPLIPEIAVLSIMSFIRYMWELRQGDNRLLSAQLEQKWIRERERTRGRLRNPNMLTGKQIAKEWATMLPRWNFDRF